MNSTSATVIANEIIQLYEQYGGSAYAGEKLTQLEHMVQAARLAEQEGYDEEVILAAFLHDVGHICVSANEDNAMSVWGIKKHPNQAYIYSTIQWAGRGRYDPLVWTGRRYSRWPISY